MSTNYIRRHEIWFAFAYIGILIAFLTQGCASISTFDATAFEKQTSCLADMRKLMDKAATPYDQNTDEINAINVTIERAYQYDRARPLNQKTTQMWELMRDPTQPMFAGFLARWKAKGQLPAVYIGYKKKLIEDAFDQITILEAAKIH